MRALVPVVMAGIISIYGLVVSVVIAGKLVSSVEGYQLFELVHCSLLCCLSSLREAKLERLRYSAISVSRKREICCTGTPRNDHWNRKSI